MPKLIAFSEPGYSGTSQGFRSNDPDLTLNGGDFLVRRNIMAQEQDCISSTCR